MFLPPHAVSEIIIQIVQDNTPAVSPKKGSPSSVSGCTSSTRRLFAYEHLTTQLNDLWCELTFVARVHGSLFYLGTLWLMLRDLLVLSCLWAGEFDPDGVVCISGFYQIGQVPISLVYVCGLFSCCPLIVHNPELVWTSGTQKQLLAS